MSALTLSTVKFTARSVEVLTAGNMPTRRYQVPHLQWTQIVLQVGPQTVSVGFA